MHQKCVYILFETSYLVRKRMRAHIHRRICYRGEKGRRIIGARQRKDKGQDNEDRHDDVVPTHAFLFVHDATVELLVGLQKMQFTIIKWQVSKFSTNKFNACHEDFRQFQAVYENSRDVVRMAMCDGVMTKKQYNII